MQVNKRLSLFVTAQARFTEEMDRENARRAKLKSEREQAKADVKVQSAALEEKETSPEAGAEVVPQQADVDEKSVVVADRQQVMRLSSRTGTVQGVSQLHQAVSSDMNVWPSSHVRGRCCCLLMITTMVESWSCGVPWRLLR